MGRVNKTTLKRVVELASKNLKGDWILLGGSLLVYLGASNRATEDIDLVSTHEHGNSDQVDLFKIAEKVGLAPEVINGAAAFFLSKIKGYKSSLELLASGTNARIFRPNLALYITLKLSRMSETDLSDCADFIRWSKKYAKEELKTGLKAVITAQSTLPESKQNALNTLIHLFHF